MNNNSDLDEMFYLRDPNIYLFAFSLYNGAEGKDHPLWQHCDRFLAHFTDKRLINQDDFFNKTSSYSINLLPQQIRLEFNQSIVYQRNQVTIDGFAEPLQIQESYALWLNVGCKEDETNNNVDVQLIQKFNPDNLLIIEDSDRFLGQTIIVTAWLTTENQQQEQEFYKTLADKCINALLPPDSRSPFYRAGELFGSPIFEYGLTSQISNYRHVLIWLFRDQEADKNFDFYQQAIIELLFYRNKIIKAFQNSREYYNELDEKYLQIQAIKSIDLNLENLKKKLEELFIITFEYNKSIGKLKDYDNTIKINLYNYNEKLQQFRGIIDFDKEELFFLETFSQKTCPHFQAQIQADLGYFERGAELVNQAIASIRGLVEIEQAESDRQRLEVEKKREQLEQQRLDKEAKTAQAERDRQDERETKLQHEIQAAGVGIAAGAIVASSSGLITQNWGQNWQVCFIPNYSCYYPHPFTVAVLLSGMFSGLAYWLTRGMLNKKGVNPPT